MNSYIQDLFSTAHTEKLFILSLINGPCKIQQSSLLSWHVIHLGLHSDCYKGRKWDVFLSHSKWTSLTIWVYSLMTTFSNNLTWKILIMRKNVDQIAFTKNTWFLRKFFDLCFYPLKRRKSDNDKISVIPALTSDPHTNLPLTLTSNPLHAHRPSNIDYGLWMAVWKCCLGVCK